MPESYHNEPGNDVQGNLIKNRDDELTGHGEHLELRYMTHWRIVSLYPQLLAEVLQHGVILSRDRFPSSKSTHLLLTYSGIGQVSVSIQLRRLPGPPFAHPNGMHKRGVQDSNTGRLATSS